MFRRSIAANSGMLSMFPKAEVVNFWMKDTILPLDMIFIRADGVEDSIARDQPPFGLANTFSAGPVIGLKAGYKVTRWFPPLEYLCCSSTAGLLDPPHVAHCRSRMFE